MHRRPPAAHSATEREFRLIECGSCGLVQRATSVDSGFVLTCARCESRLQQSTAAHGLVSACLCVGGLLSILAVSEPVFEMHLAGRYAAAGLLSGPVALAGHDMAGLSLVVLFTLAIAPLARLLILALAALGTRMRSPPAALLRPLALAETMAHWSMIPVFLLAALVCYVRLRSWAQLQIGGAVFALIALALVSAMADTFMDPQALWERIPWRRRPPPATEVPQIACSWCRLVNEASEGHACARCGHRLHGRKRNSLQCTCAFLVAAVILALPANLLPVMAMVRFGRSQTNTIFSGVVELVQYRMSGLALVIFVASIVIPMLKILALGALVWTTAKRRAGHLRARTRIFHFVRAVGRWSMVDVFAVTILVSLVHTGVLASVQPRSGVVAFCAVVLMTMLATHAFDPRLMWDAAEQNPDQGSGAAVER